MSRFPEKPPARLLDVSNPGFWLVGLYVLAAIWGVRNIHNQPSPLDLLLPFALAVCLGMWSIRDARKKRHQIPMLAKSWFFLLYFIVVPGYVIWSRGLRGLAWVVVHLVLWFGLMIVAWFIGGFVLFGDAWLQALGR